MMRNAIVLTFVLLLPTGLAAQAEEDADTVQAEMPTDSLQVSKESEGETTHDILETAVFSALVGLVAAPLVAAPTAVIADIGGAGAGLSGLAIGVPGVIAAAATAGGAIFDDQDAPAIHRFGAALGGAYMPLVASSYLNTASSGDGVGLIMLLATPFASSAAAILLPRGDWRTTLALVGAWAPGRHEVCESCGAGATVPPSERIHPPLIPSVGISHAVAEDLWIGAEVSGFVVEEGFDFSTERQIVWAQEHIATSLMATADLRPAGIAGWALHVGGGAGFTTFHEYLGPAFAAGISLMRPVSPTDRAGIRVRGLWFDGVPVITIGARLDSSS